LGIDDSKLEEVVESFETAGVRKNKLKIKEKEKTWKLLAKYFAHGIAFSLLFTILTIAWFFGLTILTVFGAFIGFIIGLGILMLIVGGVNSFLTSLLWFPVRTSLWSLVGHGLVLFIALLIVDGIFVMIPSVVFPRIVTTVITFIFGSFLNGFVARNVAGWWRQEYQEDISKAIESEWRDKNL